MCESKVPDLHVQLLPGPGTVHFNVFLISATRLAMASRFIGRKSRNRPDYKEFLDASFLSARPQRFHAYRAFGRDRHYRHPDRAVAARGAEDPPVGGAHEF